MDDKELTQNIEQEVKKEVEDVKSHVDFSLESLTLSKSSVLTILEDLRVIKKRFSHIENILKESERAQHRPSRDLPGISGIFDGEHMLTPEGVKMDVPKNYAAKSLLVYGDELKRMEQDGKEAFKILTKVPRKKIEGLLSKKDGKYVILSDAGSFNLSKNAVEFRNIKQGEWISAVIPEKGPTGNFAAIDKIITKDKNKEVKFFDVKKDEKKSNESRPAEHKPAEHKPAEHKPQHPRQDAKPQPKPQSQPQAPKQDQSQVSKASFDDEDLV